MDPWIFNERRYMMAVPVMMCGGHRDGEILEVPGYLEPESKLLRVTMRVPYDPYGPPLGFDASIPRTFVDLHIVPRKASSGPAWKIDLPKELW
jgi:hypothetical protein